jgi:DNA-binding NarL/FixJ family response regulator
MIKVLIADDHKLVREGLKSVLAQMAPDMQVIGEAATGKEVIILLDKVQADVVLMDIDMPEMNGIETTRYLSGMYPETKVLMLTMVDKEQFVHESLRAGAQGYVLKSAGRNELLHAIRVVAQGEEYFSADLTRMLLNRESSHAPATAAMAMNQKQADSLTNRELEVLRLIGQGYTNAEIADLTFTSKRTVESHRQNLLDKTGCNNTATLVRYAATHGLLT